MLRLSMRREPVVPLEAECVRPDVLCPLSVAQIETLTVWHGNREEKLGEFFAVQGSGDSGEVHVEGVLSKVKWLGAQMSGGRLVIHGSAGMHVGAQMRGGSIEVYGDVGDWLGAEMRGGKIHVHGNAGHLVGSAYRGSRAGMRGGVILVEGSAGFEVGHGLRRGLIVIGGDVGDFCGVNVIAGTICVFGRVGWRVGAAMKRGSVVLVHSESGFQPLPTYRKDSLVELVWLRLLARQLCQWGFVPRALSSMTQGTPTEQETGEPILSASWGEQRYWRYCGDFAELGKGEILVRAS
ncbi:MAG: formylmethanofuran dehydrogenase subunit C [Gemmatales bacterium]|nr:formylmethanofuran dehydrogenase subunit C [Gemmatales bacterium]MDW7993651.1 formylmethanofuran dehydrogenase subunit C [Gemmatales bacterium]